jgi:hypothetical protein
VMGPRSSVFGYAVPVVILGLLLILLRPQLKKGWR